MMKMLLCGTLLCCILLPAWAQTESAQTAGSLLQVAMQKINAGSVDEGIVDLVSLTEAYPAFLPGWNSLAGVYRRNSDLGKSLTAFKRAAELAPTSRALFSVGVAYGLLDDLDNAFEWLFKARDMGTFLVANVAASPAAANLQDDERYQSLFPADSEYADSFVEGTKVIQDWYGESAGDTFGWIARNIGDVDGDGVNDVTTSSPGFSSAVGKIYTYSGRTGDLLWSAVGKHTGGRLGHGIEAAGDVNADGVPDVVAGAPYVNLVTVFSGIDGKELFTVAGADTSGAFGLSVKGVGDVDGDGHSDILIGEPFQVFGGAINRGDLSGSGQIYVISGADQSRLMEISGEGAGHGYGSSVSGASHSRGFTLVVGAPGAGEEGNGKSYIYTSLSGRPHFTAEPDSGAAQYGSMFLSVVGDLDADGYEDVYISDWGDNSVAPGAGKIYLYSGRDGALLYSLAGENSAEGFGIGISDAGDVNRDGFDDLVVGAWQNASAAPSGGKLFIHSGNDGSLLFEITGKVEGETLGFDSTGMGDVDGDGYVDFLITSAYSMKNGFQSGRTLILSGNPEENHGKH